MLMVPTAVHTFSKCFHCIHFDFVFLPFMSPVSAAFSFTCVIRIPPIQPDAPLCEVLVFRAYCDSLVSCAYCTTPLSHRRLFSEYYPCN